MAVSTANLEHAAGAHGGSDSPSSKPKKEDNRDLVQFRIESFVQDSGMSHEMKNKTGSQKDGKRDRTEITKTTRADYTKFLADYVPKMAKAYDKLAELFKDGAKNEFTEDFELFKVLAGKKETGDYNTEFDNPQALDALRSRIDNFLNSPRGFVLANMAMERQTEREAFALGLLPKTNPGPREDKLEQPQKTPLGMGEGPLGYGARKIQEFFSEPTASFDGRKGKIAIMGMWNPPFWFPPTPALRSQFPFIFSNVHDQNRLQTGILIAGSGAALAGAAAVVGVTAPISLTALGIAAIPAGAEALALAVGKGVTRDYEKNPAIAGKGLEYLKKDTNRAEFAKIMTGVDIFNPDATPVNRDDLRRQVDEKIKTRMDFLNSIGADRASADALSAGFLFNPDGKGYPEKTAAKYAIDIAEAFKADEGGILDIHGRTRKIKNPAGEWVNNTAFDANNLDVTGNLERFDEARRKVMMKYLQEYTTKEMKRNVERPTYQEKIEARSNDTVKKERSKEFQEQINALNKDKETLTSEVVPFKSFSETATELDKARLDFKRKFPSITDIDAAILDRLTSLEDAGVPGFAQEDAKLWSRRETEVNTAVAALTTKGKARQQEEQEIVERANKRYQASLEALNERVTKKVSQEIADLRTAKETIAEKEKQLVESEAGKSVMDRLKTWGQAFDEIKGWDAVGGAALTDNDLRTKTYEELLEEINKVYAADKSKGWPKERNQLADLRTKLWRAVVESRARDIEQQPVNKPWIDMIPIMEASGISENQLRALTPEQILKMANADFAASGGTRGLNPADNSTNLPRVETLSRTVRNRLKWRQDITEEEIKKIDPLINELNGKIADLEPGIKKEAEKLEVTRDLIGNFERIVDNAPGVRREKDKYTDRATVTATDTTFTEAERNKGYAKGYYEFMDLMFDYKQKTNRAEQFNKITEVVPPDKLMAIMLNSLPPVTPAPANFDEFLNYLNTQISSGNIQDNEIRNSFFAVFRSYTDEADAM